MSNASIGFSGHFTMTKYKALKDEHGNFLFDEQGNHVLGESEQVADFPNLILDSGLEKMGTGDAIEGCAVGSGGSTPVATQTALDAVVGVSTTVQAEGEGASNYTTEPYYSSYYRTFRFNAGQATGNLSEIGIGWGINTTSKTISGLWSRALIKDVNGNPTTITLLSDEVLDIKYTIQLIVPKDDITGTVKISSEDYNYIIRPVSVQQATTWSSGIYGYSAGRYPYYIGRSNFFSPQIGVATNTNLIDKRSQVPGITSNLAFSGSKLVNSYLNNARIKTVLSLGLNDGNNSNGIRTIFILYYSYAFQIQFSRVSDGAAIPKDATKILNIPFTISWGRANAL